MKKALVLHGGSNTGKSTALYELIKLFPKKSIIFDNKHNLSKNSNRKYPEYTVVIKYNNKVICITTKGDNLNCVQQELNKLKQKRI